MCGVPMREVEPRRDRDDSLAFRKSLIAPGTFALHYAN